MTLNILENDTQNNVTWQNDTYKSETQDSNIKLNNTLILSLTRATLRTIPLLNDNQQNDTQHFEK